MTPSECKPAVATFSGHSERHLSVLSPLFYSAPCSPDLFVGSHEPTLNELLDDPILDRLLASDGVARATLLSLIAEARKALIKN